MRRDRSIGVRNAATRRVRSCDGCADPRCVRTFAEEACMARRLEWRAVGAARRRAMLLLRCSAVRMVAIESIRWCAELEYGVRRCCCGVRVRCVAVRCGPSLRLRAASEAREQGSRGARERTTQHASQRPATMIARLVPRRTVTTARPQPASIDREPTTTKGAFERADTTM